VLYHVLGGSDSQYRPHYGKDENNITHWWLVDITTNKIFDPTSEQYTQVEEKHLPMLQVEKELS